VASVLSGDGAPSARDDDRDAGDLATLRAGRRSAFELAAATDFLLGR
jgi:hypothetical protein